jgi:hypothetical protein
MKKLNLDTTINHNTLTLDLNSNFKLFAFIDEELISKYELLGFNVEVDDEVNNIYYAEIISNDLLLLNHVYDECIELNIGFHTEYEDIMYRFDEVEPMFLS